jgi:hypothetical protein
VPHPHPLAQAVSEVLYEAARVLDPSTYSLVVRQPQTRGRDHWLIELLPTNDKSAAVVAHVTAGQPVLDLTVGAATRFEYQLGDSVQLSREEASEVADVARAAIRGHVREVLGLVDGRVVTARGWVGTEGSELTSRWGEAFYPWWRRHEQQVTYDPYSPEAH